MLERSPHRRSQSISQRQVNQVTSTAGHPQHPKEILTGEEVESSRQLSRFPCSLTNSFRNRHTHTVHQGTVICATVQKQIVLTVWQHIVGESINDNEECSEQNINPRLLLATSLLYLTATTATTAPVEEPAIAVKCTNHGRCM